jgi:hypothetical protein
MIGGASSAVTSRRGGRSPVDGQPEMNLSRLAAD